MRIGTREAALLAVAVLAVAAILVLLLRPTGTTTVPSGAPSGASTGNPATAASPLATPAPFTTPAPGTTPGPGSTPAVTPPAPTVTLVGAGDIADCDSDGDTETAALVEAIPGTVITLGDNAYEDGKLSEFRRCYEPTWGAFKDRTRPAPGNHDYFTAGAAGYFEYFGDQAGPAGRGYYAYTLGAWRIYALNSQCDEIGGCGEGSDQLGWLQEDLAANPSRCALAYWHHPRYSSGEHGDQAVVDPMWDVLYDAGVELVLAGHDHSYERFAPMDAAGDLAPDKGITSFVVGTGGREFYEFRDVLPTSRARATGVPGVIELTLNPGSWSSRFVPVPGSEFTDGAQDVCH